MINENNIMAALNLRPLLSNNMGLYMNKCHVPSLLKLQLTKFQPNESWDIEIKFYSLAIPIIIMG